MSLVIWIIDSPGIYMESSHFFWEGARPATARGAAPYRSHGCFEIGGSRQLAARSRSEAVPFGSDTGRAQCRNGRCPPHKIRASLLHNIGEKHWKASQKLMFAALGFTPLCRNTIFIWKLLKSIEQMKVLLTTPAYLHGDLRLERHIYKSIVFYCNINVFFICIFTMVMRCV